MDNVTQVLAVQHMQDYIKIHLKETITLYQLAKVAQYSPFHCTRLFKELVGMSPFEYIRSLRLSHAAITLRDEQQKVVDIAFDYVFDSHEGFTRAFFKQFGIKPKLYSQQTPPIHLFTPYSVYHQYLSSQKGEKKMKNQTTTIFVQVCERPQRKLILRRGIEATDYFSYCNEVSCDIWGLLCSIKERSMNQWVYGFLKT